MLVSQILREKGHDVIAVLPEVTLLEASVVLAKHRIGALIVQTSGGAFTGIISERDIIQAIAEDGPEALADTVAARMTREVAVCGENTAIEEVMETMTFCRFRHMPVMEDGRIAGIVSIGDVVKTRIAETLSEAQALKNYIATG